MPWARAAGILRLVFFNKRRRYNGTVATLLPAFGFTLEEAGPIKTLEVLDTAWQQNYSVNEAALFVAYLFLHGAITKDYGDVAETLRRIKFVQADWVKKGIVRQELAERFSAKANEWLPDHSANPPMPHDAFVASLPDPDANVRLAFEQFGDLDVAYFENPSTIGESMGLPQVFACPQVAVIARGDRPILLVRLERSPFATSMLATLDTTGQHANYGSAEMMPQRAFIVRAVALAREHEKGKTPRSSSGQA